MSTAAASGTVLVLAYGNPSRGDDALGPELLAQLEVEQAAGTLPEVDLITDFQLQVEHVLDLQDRALVLFADASVSAPEPFGFSRLQVAGEVGYTTHTLSPGQLLAVFHSVNGRAPPPAFLLAIRGYEFELGAPLSAAARGNLGKALQLVRALLADCQLRAWTERVADHESPA